MVVNSTLSPSPIVTGPIVSEKESVPEGPESLTFELPDRLDGRSVCGCAAAKGRKAVLTASSALSQIRTLGFCILFISFSPCEVFL